MDKIRIIKELIENISKDISFKKYFNFATKQLKKYYGAQKFAFLYYDFNEKILYSGEENGYELKNKQEKIDLEEKNLDIKKVLSDDDVFVYNIHLKNRIMGVFLVDKEIEEIEIILNLFSIVFERAVLAGSLPWQGFEDELKMEYLVETLQGYGLKRKEEGDTFSFAVLEVKLYNNIFDKAISPIDNNVFEYTISKLRDLTHFKDEVFALPDFRIGLVLDDIEEEQLKARLLDFERKIENIDIKEVKYSRVKEKSKLKINYGYSICNKKIYKIKEIVKDAFDMLGRNRKMEGWLKKI